MLKIRSPSATPCAEHEDRERHRRHPLGPNQAMNAFVAVSRLCCRRARSKIAIGRATSSVKATIATAAQPSPNRPSKVSSEPKTTKIPSLTISTMSSARSDEVWARSGRRMPERDRADEHRDEPVAAGWRPYAVGRERHAEHVQRLVVVRDAVPRRRARAASARRPRSRGRSRRRSPRPTSCRTNSYQTKSPWFVASAAREGQHRRQREAVVQPRLEVEGVADEARHPRVGDDARRQHGIGRRQQGAEQE